MCNTSANPLSEKHAKTPDRAKYKIDYNFKYCTVCTLILPTLYNNSKPQQNYAMEQGNAVPVLVHISYPSDGGWTHTIVFTSSNCQRLRHLSVARSEAMEASCNRSAARTGLSNFGTSQHLLGVRARQGDTVPGHQGSSRAPGSVWGSRKVCVIGL